MIHKIARPIDCIVPGTIRILRFEDEVQVSLCGLAVVVIRKELRRAN